jgi:hypothetical protein
MLFSFRGDATRKPLARRVQFPQPTTAPESRGACAGSCIHGNAAPCSVAANVVRLGQSNRTSSHDALQVTFQRLVVDERPSRRTVGIYYLDPLMSSVDAYIRMWELASGEQPATCDCNDQDHDGAEDYRDRCPGVDDPVGSDASANVMDPRMYDMAQRGCTRRQLGSACTLRTRNQRLASLLISASSCTRPALFALRVSSGARCSGNRRLDRVRAGCGAAEIVDLTADRGARLVLR